MDAVPARRPGAPLVLLARHPAHQPGAAAGRSPGVRLFRSLARGQELAPFLCALGWFVLSFVGLGISLYPLIVPPTVTIWDAAAPRESQMFLLVGAAVMIPVIIAYSGYAYWVFRGKVQHGAGYH